MELFASVAIAVACLSCAMLFEVVGSLPGKDRGVARTMAWTMLGLAVLGALALGVVL